MGGGALTWRDLVRKHIPEATGEECNYILWNLTCFPLCGMEMVEAQIVDVAKVWKGGSE